MSVLERGHFWPQGYNLNNIGRGLLGEAMYQISKALAFWFQIRRFLNLCFEQKYEQELSEDNAARRKGLIG